MSISRCPGRHFARQEVVAIVAILLTNFDVEFLSFVERDEKGVKDLGRGAEKFPRMAKALPGNQVMGLKGDMRVRIKRRVT